MGARRTRAAALAALFGLLLGMPIGAAHAEAPTVIVLSWDGTRHDAPDVAGADAAGLTRIQAEGARADRLVPVYPSSTFPGHVSLATGTYPDRHGIVDNRFLDRERGVFRQSDDASWIQAEPLWVAAERQGVPSATYFWVGSETDWNGVGARHRKAPFDAGIGEARKVRQILAWLDREGPDRPRLIMAWWRGSDRAGHQTGPDDPQVRETLLLQDRHLVTLLQGIDARELWADTTLLLVSDHGMTRVVGELPIRRQVRASGIRARVHTGAAVAHVFLEDASDAAPLRAALRTLDGARVVPGPELPDALRLRHPTRTGDLVVMADPGYVFRSSSLTRRTWRWMRGLLGATTGMHGYDPDHPDMGAAFLALGRGVPRGARLGPVRMVDVAPTVAALLGIDPPQHSEGRPIPELTAP